jgi:hypothetical protein
VKIPLLGSETSKISPGSIPALTSFSPSLPDIRKVTLSGIYSGTLIGHPCEPGSGHRLPLKKVKMRRERGARKIIEVVHVNESTKGEGHTKVPTTLPLS